MFYLYGTATVVASTATTQISGTTATVPDKTTTADVTLTAGNTATSENKFVAFFKRALAFVDSTAIYHLPILSFWFGFMAAEAFVGYNNRGCYNPRNGRHVQNGWHELSSDCRVECFCKENEFYCQLETCDLYQNECAIDAFGVNFCNPICSSGYFWDFCSGESFDCTEADTSDNNAPSFAVDGVIDVQANQQVGTIENYYQNYEFSFEARILGNLTSDRTYSDSSILGFLKKFNLYIMYKISIKNSIYT